MNFRETIEQVASKLEVLSHQVLDKEAMEEELANLSADLRSFLPKLGDDELRFMAISLLSNYAAKYVNPGFWQPGREQFVIDAQIDAVTMILRTVRDRSILASDGLGLDVDKVLVLSAWKEWDFRIPSSDELLNYYGILAEAIGHLEAAHHKMKGGG